MQDISFILNNDINYRLTSNLPEDVLQTQFYNVSFAFLRDGSFTFTLSCLFSETLII